MFLLFFIVVNVKVWLDFFFDWSSVLVTSDTCGTHNYQQSEMYYEMCEPKFFYLHRPTVLH